MDWSCHIFILNVYSSWHTGKCSPSGMPVFFFFLVDVGVPAVPYRGHAQGKAVWWHELESEFDPLSGFLNCQLRQLCLSRFSGNRLGSGTV